MDRRVLGTEAKVRLIVCQAVGKQREGQRPRIRQTSASVHGSSPHNVSLIPPPMAFSWLLSPRNTNTLRTLLGHFAGSAWSPPRTFLQPLPLEFSMRGGGGGKEGSREGGAGEEREWGTGKGFWW